MAEHRAGAVSRWRRPIGAVAAAAAAIALMALPAAAGTSYSVTDTINFGGQPWGVAADAGTGTVYVTISTPSPNPLGPPDIGTVAVIDAATNTITTTVPVGHVPVGVAVDDFTGTVYVANSFDGTVSVIGRATGSNGPTYTPAATVKVGSNPQAVAVDAASHTVYVANGNDRSVSVIDATTNLVTATVNVGTSPAGVAIDPTSHTVYVTNHDDSTVSVITPTTASGVTSYTVAAPVHVGIAPIGVAIDPGSQAVYVGNLGSNSVSVIDPATHAVTTVNVGNNPAGVAVDASTHAVYVTNNNDSANSVSVIDGSAPIPTVAATVSVGANPQGVAVYDATGHNHAAYVANISSRSVSVITAQVSDTDLAITAPDNVTVDATGPSGATVSYPPPVVTDGDDTTAPAAVCTPASGSVFPIGTTTVTCTATDTDDTPSSVSTSFTVSVKGAAAQLADLRQAVQGVGPGTSLSDKVTTAQSYLTSGNVPDTCSTLTAFTHQVQAQSGKHIPTDTAKTLLADAQRIQAVLAC